MSAPRTRGGVRMNTFAAVRRTVIRVRRPRRKSGPARAEVSGRVRRRNPDAGEFTITRLGWRGSNGEKCEVDERPANGRRTGPGRGRPDSRREKMPAARYSRADGDDWVRRG